MTPNTTSTPWISSIVTIIAILVSTALPANAAPPQPPGPRGYFVSLGEEVQQLLYRELSEHERQALRGHVATIDVRYSSRGQFESARVRSADANALAVTLHRKLAWKSLPAGMNQTAACLEIQVIDHGRIVIRCESR